MVAMPRPVHPIQPLVTDPSGAVRFHANAIVVHLLDKGGIDMNALAVLPFSAEDRQQFAQLIGYSLEGYAELSYVSDDAYAAAADMAERGCSSMEARARVAEAALAEARERLREGVAALYGIDPEMLAR